MRIINNIAILFFTSVVIIGCDSETKSVLDRDESNVVFNFLIDVKSLEIDTNINPVIAFKELAEEISDTKMVVSRKNEVKISQIEKLKATYTYIRAKFISTDEGDLFYYNFKDEKGTYYSFSYLKDESYELLNASLEINPKYKNKYFDIFYQAEKHDLLRWGTKQDYDVVIKMILVEENNTI